MNFKSDAKPKLQALAAKDKFEANGLLYTGVRDPVLRARLTVKINSSINRFLKAVQQGASRKDILALLASEISTFPRIELGSEDAGQVAGTFEEIMDCLGLESSDGILNVWMYGFDPAKIKKSP
jgi:hypothetical protein